MTIIILVFAYLLGSVPVGRVVARVRGIDIEKTGSGNVGATNVARSVGAGAGLVTLAGDVLKGSLSAWLGYWYFQDLGGAALAGMTAVFGHCLSFPGFLKGGKGVATSLGAITVISPLLGACAVGAFAVVFFISRTVSIASLGAALAVPVTAIIIGLSSRVCWPIVAIALLIVQRHQPNIVRLLKGEEPRFSLKGKGAKSSS